MCEGAEGRRERREGGSRGEGKEGRRGRREEGGGGRGWWKERGKEDCLLVYKVLFIPQLSPVLFPLLSLPVQSPPQIKAQLPSNATACYALAVSADGKVCDVTINCMSHVVVHANTLG